MQALLSFVPLNVPYRFLNPWLHEANNQRVVERAWRWECDPPYRLVQQEGSRRLWGVEVSPRWVDYLCSHCRVLADFTLWHLVRYMESRNPGVPGIATKIVRPERRASLIKQRKFWYHVMVHLPQGLRCIYTDKPLRPGQYDLDHFMVWSFVAHDRLWNLLPADPSINSSKGDRLPPLECYLPQMARAHGRALAVALQTGYPQKALQDYLTLGHSLTELVGMSPSQLEETYLRTYNPLSRTAANMGFQLWLP